MRLFPSRLSLAALAMIAPTALFAHEGGHASGFAAGLGHPVGGTDHLLAMVAVGLWAAVLGGRAVWALPVSFVGAMLLGGVAGFSGLPMPGVEPMIVASAVLLGVAAALLLRVPTAVAAASVAAFGLFHGHAHGMEAGDAGFATFAAGFALATLGLHLAGLALGWLLQSRAAQRVLRVIGAGVAFAGLSLVFG